MGERDKAFEILAEILGARNQVENHIYWLTQANEWMFSPIALNLKLILRSEGYLGDLADRYVSEYLTCKQQLFTEE